VKPGKASTIVVRATSVGRSTHTIAADRRTRGQHLFPKPKSSVLMSSHLSENSGVGICEIRKTVGRKASNRKCKTFFVRMRSSKNKPPHALNP
jgi:hypothetical protein